MLRYRLSAVVLFALTLAGPVMANDQLIPHTAVYQANYNGLPITARKELRPVEGGYRLSLKAKNFLGRIEEEEHFHLTQDGAIATDRYHYERSILGRGREESMAVNDNRTEAVYHRKGEREVLPMKERYLGPLSYQLQIRQDLIDGVDDLCYSVIYRSRIKEFRFRRLGTETLATPAGEFEAIKLERVRDDDDRETLLWVAPALDYLPLKLWQREEDGETYEMLLKTTNLLDERS